MTELKGMAARLDLDEAALIKLGLEYKSSATACLAAVESPWRENHVKYSALMLAGISEPKPLLQALLAAQGVTAPSEKHRKQAAKALRAVESLHGVNATNRGVLSASSEYEDAAADLVSRELCDSRTEVVLRSEVVRRTREAAAEAHNKCAIH